MRKACDPCGVEQNASALLSYQHVVAHFSYLFVGLLVVVHCLPAQAGLLVLVLWLLRQINYRKTLTFQP
jgi:hypothetical protein